MKIAVIQTGGKQYQAIEGKTLAIEKVANCIEYYFVVIDQ